MRARLVPLSDAPGLLPAWRELAEHALEPNPYAEPAMLGPAARGLPAGDAARLLVVEDAAALLLALPVVHQSVFRRVPLRAMTTWRHPHLAVGLPLIAPVELEPVWRTALAALRAEAPWLALEHLALDGPVWTALQRSLDAQADVWNVFDPWQRPIVNRRPDNTYVDGRISARRLKALRRHRRRLTELLGDVRVEDLARTPSWSAAVDGFVEMELAGWKGRSGGAIGCDDAQRAWFRESMATLQAADRLQLWALWAGDRVLAYQVNAVAGTTVFHLKVAYDEQFAAASPGLQLELAMVDEFHSDQRLQRIDPCTDPGTVVSEQLYPDRRPMGTVLIAGTRVGRMAVRGFPRAASAYDRVRERARRAPAAAQ